MRLANFRANTILPWMFLTIIVLYFLHSSDLLLRPDPNADLSSTSTSLSLSSSENISVEGNLGTTEALCNITSALKELREEEEDERVAAAAAAAEDQRSSSSSVLCDRSKDYETELKHVVFGIAASANLWLKRKEYIKLWWRPKEMRGVVWLDRKVNLSVSDPCEITIW